MRQWLLDRIRASLAVRLALLTGGLLSLATVLIGVIIFTAGRRSLQEQIRSSLNGLACSRAAEIAGIVEQDYERTALIASRTRLRECLLNIAKGEEPELNRAQMVRILSHAIASVDAVHLAEVMDRSCTSIATAGEHMGADTPPSQSLCRAGMVDFIHGDWFLLNGVLHCDVYGPLTNPRSGDDEVIGLIRTSFTVDRILDILADYTGLGRTGELVLGVQEGGRIVTLGPCRHDSGAASKRALPDGLGIGVALRRAAVGQRGFMDDYRDYRGVRTLAAYMPVPAGNYFLVAKIDRAEALAPIFRLALWGGVGGVAIILLGLVCAVGFARVLVRPIRALDRATRAIAKGDFAHRVPVFGTDEAGRLAESFNNMVRRIKEITASRDELNREIEERTRAEANLAETADRLEDKNLSMTEDLNMARDIQAALLPRKQIAFRSSTVGGQNTLNFAHFYRPSLALGGDFFQVIPLSDHSAAAVVCDVMGHGVRSALVTAIFRGMLEEHRQDLDDPAQMLCRLNRGLMTVLSQPEQFTLVSAACLVFDLRLGRVACANAGHPPPLTINRSGGDVTSLGPDVDQVGPALGTDPNPYYEVGYHSMREEDRFLLYTDGLFEVSPPDSDAFLGKDQFVEIVARRCTEELQEMIDGIVKDLETYRGGTDFDDDLCLLSVELGSL
ncbi:MAG: SpoIIE family protein phosphatase [Kiritimatiellae bacterium]|nr:SpoIIE family protein phosphatase [Kiritimatiellia bacterium]